MKRLFSAAVLLALSAAAWSQVVVSYDDFANAFSTVAEQAAPSLPAASPAGVWSPALLGQFPHFGAGVTAGAWFLPYDALEPALSALALGLPAGQEWIGKAGLPQPLLAVDGRLGGFGLPFDLGLRFGWIPAADGALFGVLDADLISAGADVRFLLLKEEGILPSISAGAGYQFVRAAASVPGVAKGTSYDIDLAGVDAGLGTLRLTDPEASFIFRTHVVNLFLQLSKDLSIFTPHIGLEGAIGFLRAWGGLKQAVYYDLGFGFNRLNQADIDAILTAFEGAGREAPELTVDGVWVGQDAVGFAVWVSGGLAVRLGFIVLDLGAQLNLLTDAFGGSLNIRVQM